MGCSPAAFGTAPSRKPRSFASGSLGIPLIFPFLVLVIEAFLVGGRVRRYNERVANEIASRLKALRKSADVPKTLAEDTSGA